MCCWRPGMAGLSPWQCWSILPIPELLGDSWEQDCGAGPELLVALVMVSLSVPSLLWKCVIPVPGDGPPAVPGITQVGRTSGSHLWNSPARRCVRSVPQRLHCHSHPSLELLVLQLSSAMSLLHLEMAFVPSSVLLPCPNPGAAEHTKDKGTALDPLQP